MPVFALSVENDQSTKRLQSARHVFITQKWQLIILSESYEGNPMSGKRSRNKGKAGERELSKELTRLFGVECRRGQQFNGIDGRDVVGLQDVHIECKRVESLRLYDAVEQATEDAGEDETPLVCHRKNGKPWLAIVPLDQLPALANKLFLTMADT